MGRPLGGRNLTRTEKREIRRRWAQGEPAEDIVHAYGSSWRTLMHVLSDAGGIPPRARSRSPVRLSSAEREEISRGLRVGESLRAIANRLGRSPSTISREVRANGGPKRYRAWRAELRRDRKARRPRPAKLATNTRLRRIVEARLASRWSPQQIARRLRHDHPDEPEMWVSHETIYQSLFVQGRGALRKELTRYLRTGRALRRPRGRTHPFNQLHDMVLISERPAEVEDRAVPGHWEGDLLSGKVNRSAIATLVERQTRFVLLVALPQNRSPEHLRQRLAETILELPVHLRRSLTWDQGREMARHAGFTVDTGVQIYFCDPHSPWQRGTNENTNGLLRQYFPKGTDLSGFSQVDLDRVADELNGRPRQTLGWLTPSEMFSRIVATTD